MIYQKSLEWCLAKTLKKTRPEILSLIINNFGCKYGAEVGLREGYFAKEILERTGIHRWFGIDRSPCPLEENIKVKYPYRFQFINEVSPKAAELFYDNSLDIIYLDNNHMWGHVKRELPIWHQKLRMGGILCGDDYFERFDPSEGQFGVVRAVSEFALENKLPFFVSGYRDIQYYNALFSSKEQYWPYYYKNLRQYILDIGDNPPEIPQWFLIKTKEL